MSEEFTTNNTKHTLPGVSYICTASSFDGSISIMASYISPKVFGPP